MIQDTKKYKVAILGQPYTIISDEPAELVEKAVAFVNMLTQTIAVQSSQLSNEKIATLALLQVALKVHGLENALEKDVF